MTYFIRENEICYSITRLNLKKINFLENYKLREMSAKN